MKSAILLGFLLISLAVGNPVKLVSQSAFEPFQAAAYAGGSGVTIQSVCNGKLVVGAMGNSDYVYYTNVDFGPGAEAVMIVFADGNTIGITGHIQFRLGSSTGTIIGQVTVDQTGDWCNYISMNAILDSVPTNLQTLYITFNTTSTVSEIVRLESFQFNSTIF
ncbi:hypothetical protein CHUAL_013664 [Chamberlinius hualienensis]